MINLTYVQKFYKEIFFNALQSALKDGLISHQDEFEDYIKNKKDISNFYVMLLSVHAEIFEQVYKDMTLVYNSINIDKAQGVDLDNIGKIVGVPRVPATRAYVDVKLHLDKAQSEELILPAGILCTTKNNIGYHTVESAYFPKDEKEVIVGAYADKKGSKYKIAEGDLRKITSKLSQVPITVKCTNVNPSSGGTDAQTDEEYRKCLKNWFKIHQKGNEWAYKNYFNHFEGLNGYRLMPRWDGSGTIKIIIDPGSDYLRNKIYRELQENVALYDDDINVMASINKEINIYAKVNVDIDTINEYDCIEKEKIKTRIINALKTYIGGGYRRNGKYYAGMQIGEDFIQHKASVFLDQEIPELKNIEWVTPSEYIVVCDEETAIVGNIEIEME